MRIFILVLVVQLSYALNFTLAQNVVSYWVEIPVQHFQLLSESEKINNIKLEFGDIVNSVEKAFPASRKRLLQNTYKIDFKVSNDSILKLLREKEGLIGHFEMVPYIEPLHSPNDYNNGYDYALNLINAEESWDITKGDSSIEIAILDGNYNINHEELVGKINYLTPNNFNSNFIHGTCVAISAAGNTNNFIGKSAIGYNSKLQLRAMNYNEILNASYSGAKIINLSWTSGCDDNLFTQSVIDEAYENGSVIVAAAGNGVTCGGSNNFVYPASHEHVISVSSIGPYNNHERFIGDTLSTHQHNSKVDICAPGYDVLLSAYSGSYLSGNGSSFAAPIVSGIVALMFAVNPCLSPDQIEQILKETAFPLDSLNPLYANKLGAGRVDAYEAVFAAANYNTGNYNYSEFYDCDYDKQVLKINSISEGTYVYWDSILYSSNAIYTNPYENHEVKIIDANDCVSKIKIFADSLSDMSLEADITHNVCYGDSTGAIEVVISGGNPPYNVVWNIDDGFQYAHDLKAGNYTLHISDSINCSIVSDFTITEPEKLSANFVFNINSFFDLGLAVVEVQGGTPPYLINWNTGDVGPCIQLDSCGFYEVDITDSKSCNISKNQIINCNDLTNFNLGFEYPEQSNEHPVIVKINNNVVQFTNISRYNQLNLYNSLGQLVPLKNPDKNDYIQVKLDNGIYYLVYFNKTGEVFKSKILVF